MILLERGERVGQRPRYRGNVFQLLGVAPFILPPVITALGMLTFWATSGFYGQPWTAAISHGIFFVTLPLVTLSGGNAEWNRPE